MEKNRLTIQLTAAHRGVGSTLFTGRPEGRKVRQELNLDEMDKKIANTMCIYHPVLHPLTLHFFLACFQ